MCYLRGEKEEHRMEKPSVSMIGRRQKPVFLNAAKCHSIKDTNTKLVSDEIQSTDNNLLDVIEPCKEGEHIRPAVYDVLVKATCEKEGQISYICTRLWYKSKTETTPKTAHVWDSKTGKCTGL